MPDMNLGMTARLEPIHERVSRMVREDIIPLDEEYFDEVGKDGASRWVLTDRQREIMGGLKAKARERGLWNFWLSDAERGHGLTTVEYAYLAEEMGKAHLASEVFNCSPPDTGNMDILLRYGSDEHKEQWLEPLLDGEIRSAYLMSEPDVASSDATQIAMRCEKRDGDYYLSGDKWWVAGAGHPDCAVYMVMALTDPDNENRYRRHSMFLVPADAKGIAKVQAQKVYGHDDAPRGHLHLRFMEVCVPAENLILGEGRGFELAQERLGPGRIHHGMRAVGQAERALDLLCQRALSREAFGHKLAQLGGNFDIIADCRMDIDMARLLCLQTAWIIDQGDARAAAPWISKCIVTAPRVALRVTDEAIQMWGGEGVGQNTPLARSWTKLRTLRLVDGPDAVHRRQVARAELRKHADANV